MIFHNEFAIMVGYDKRERRGSPMFSGFFNYDNPVWRFIGKFWDVIILSFLWGICSIPIFTVGASTTAMYYVTLKLVRDEDGYTVRSFFKSFKENFKQATVIWLIMLAVGLILGGDLWFFLKVFHGDPKFRSVMIAIFLAFLFIYLAIFTYVFALQARFYNTIRKTLFNAFFMSIRHFPHTLGMLAIDVVLIIVALFYFPPLMLFGVALLAFANSYMLSSVFKRYMPEEREDNGELRPLFADEDEAEAKLSQENSEEEKNEV